MPVKRIEPTETTRVLGRHTRLALTFQWKEPSGDLVDLDGYTARVWVTSHAGEQVGQPRTAQVGGTKVTYQMDPADLAEASPTSTQPVYFTCVAENADTVLPPNKRAVVVGDWTGADNYQPVP